MMNSEFLIESLNWDKVSGLIPAIIQDYSTSQVLMMGYMNKDALQKTLETNKVTFYSRTKMRLWTKGETSGNILNLVNIVPDCDKDSLLIQVKPKGASCHLNNRSCFDKANLPDLNMLSQLETIINQRYEERPTESYISSLFKEGTHRIAQKVGEESIEVVLAAVTGLKNSIINEAADLLFHLLVLLRQTNVNLVDIMDELQKRSKP